VSDEVNGMALCAYPDGRAYMRKYK